MTRSALSLTQAAETVSTDSVIDDIDVTQQTQSVKLPDFSFDVYGQLIVRDPEAEVSDQGGAVLCHTHEIQAVSTGGGGDIITENKPHSGHTAACCDGADTE